jgi:CO/xanthine dehydrogenase FAD-binding subunit
MVEDILDISRLQALRGVREEAPTWRIGALTTWSDLARARLPRLFDALQRAAREVGGVQIQNCGTVAGNLCNASPAADGVPALLALDARVELASRAGRRTVPLPEFIVGSRRTIRRADELVTAVLVPARGQGARSTFLKLGARHYLVISIAMVAVRLDPAADGTVEGAAVAVGACSAVAQRLPTLEARLAGRPLTAALADLPRASDFDPLTPIDDIRGTAAYRADAALTLVRRALRELADE